MSYSIAKYYAETKISHEKNDTKRRKPTNVYMSLNLH